MKILQNIFDDSSRRLFSTENTEIVGRSGGSTISLSDGTASRRHAKLTDVSGTDRIVLEDLNSLNGTYVDGQRVDGSVVVTSGSTIRFGVTETYRYLVQAQEKKEEQTLHLS